MLAHQGHDLFGEEVQGAVLGGHAEEEGDAHQSDEHVGVKGLGDVLGTDTSNDRQDRPPKHESSACSPVDTVSRACCR